MMFVFDKDAPPEVQMEQLALQAAAIIRSKMASIIEAVAIVQGSSVMKVELVTVAELLAACLYDQDLPEKELTNVLEGIRTLVKRNKEAVVEYERLQREASDQQAKNPGPATPGSGTLH